MRIKRLFLMVVILIATISFTGCKKKKDDACVDPNCEDPSCAVPGEKAVTTQRELDPQSICPIMGAPIDKAIYVDKDKLRIYVSEESAKQELTANFEKYVEELKGMGQKPETLE